MPLGEYLAVVKQRRAAAREARDAAAEEVRYPVHTELPYSDAVKGEQMTAAEITALGLPVIAAGKRADLFDGPMASNGFAAAVADGHVIVVLTGGRTAGGLRGRTGPGVTVTSLDERAGQVTAGVAESYGGRDRDLEGAAACRQAPEGLSRDLPAMRGRVMNPDVLGVLDGMARFGRLTSGEKRRLSLIAGARAQSPGLFPPAPRHRDLARDYPLLASVRWGIEDTERDHVAAYLNAVGGTAGDQKAA